MQAACSSRVAVPTHGSSRCRAAPGAQRLVAFTGFRAAGVVDCVSARSAPTLQAAVQKAIRSSGAKSMRVTRMMFERFTEKAIKVSTALPGARDERDRSEGQPGTRDARRS